MTFSIDPTLFRDDAIDDETRALNASIVERLRAGPDQWSMPPAEVRIMRERGEGPFPLTPKSSRAETMTIYGPAGDLDVRIIRPQGRSPKGVYLHLHGGGWTWGAADQQDPRLERIADRAGFAVASLDYRLAPEHPYPAAPDDCEAAALWLVRESKSLFGTELLAIGGESAGAHLAATTLVRLRDRHGPIPFAGANLVAGCYDLALTPSAANWGDEPLVLNTRAVRTFIGNFLASETDPAYSDISPLRADLRRLPPALFTVGTRDILLDDTLFMAARWAAAGNETDLAVWPGGAHSFVSFPGKLTEQALERMETFLDGLAG